MNEQLIESLMLYVGLGNFLGSVVVLSIKSSPLFQLWVDNDKHRLLVSHLASAFCTCFSYIGLEDSWRVKMLPLMFVLGFASELVIKAIKLNNKK
jgi:hypothetical protein